MSYTPTNWKAGDTVTSTKLNKMEQGIALSNLNTAIEINYNDASWGYIFGSSNHPETLENYIQLPFSYNDIKSICQQGRQIKIWAFQSSGQGKMYSISQIDISEFIEIEDTCVYCIGLLYHDPQLSSAAPIMVILGANNPNDHLYITTGSDDSFLNLLANIPNPR